MQANLDRDDYIRVLAVLLFSMALTFRNLIMPNFIPTLTSESNYSCLGSKCREYHLLIRKTAMLCLPTAGFSIGTRRKICIFNTYYQMSFINYNSVKFKVDRLRNKKVSIYPQTSVIMITQWDK